MPNLALDFFHHIEDISLNHEFLLLKKHDLLNNGYRYYHHSPDALYLHDDFISYIYDTLQWIPAFNPSVKKFHKGINRWGVTVFEIGGAKKVRSVFSLWAALFSEGPETLNLKGDWSYYDEKSDEYGDDGKYERIILSRDELVNTLTKISLWAEQIVESNGEYNILHMGI